MEKTNDQISQISIHPLLAERDNLRCFLQSDAHISIHPLLAERDCSHMGCVLFFKI